MTQLMRGYKLGKYTIRRLIGRGRRTEVYRALHPDLKRDVAIKMFYPNVPKTSELASCFQREAGAIARLKHPNIIRVYDFDAQNNIMYYMAMELIESSNLRDVISAHHTGLNRDDVLRLFTQIASAVSYAHDQGLVHGNIKPNNVLIDTGNRPVVTDFSINCFLESGQPLSGAVGTFMPTYLAPEQIQGQPITPRTDIYALGILLYEMVTGDVPFKGLTRDSVINHHLRTSPTPPSQINVELDPRIERAILKALQKDPEDRYTSGREMLSDIESQEEIDQYETLNLGHETSQRVRKRRSEIRHFRVSRMEHPVEQGWFVSLFNSWNRALVAAGILLVVVVVIGLAVAFR